MRTQTIELYTFDELSPEAQQSALDNWRHTRSDYDWCDEWRDSAKAFADAVGARIKDYSVSSWGPVYCSIEWDNSDWWYLDDDPADTMTGLRLRTWIINNWLPNFWKGKYYSCGERWENGKYRYKSRHSRITGGYKDCPLTGYCADYDLIKPLLDFVAKPDNHMALRELLQECFDDWAIAWQQDMEAQDSDDYIRETIEANGYEFLENGDMA